MKEDKTEVMMVSITVDKADKTRISRLRGRVGKTPCEVISDALKFYEDALDVTDKVRSRYSSMSFEVDSNEAY